MLLQHSQPSVVAAAAAHLEERHEVSWRIAQNFLGWVVCKLSERLTLYVRVQALHVTQTPADRQLVRSGSSSNKFSYHNKLMAMTRKPAVSTNISLYT